jgi:hypothetical protein
VHVGAVQMGHSHAERGVAHFQQHLATVLRRHPGIVADFRTRAKALQGMLVKARITAADPTAVSTVDDLEHSLEERLETGHIIGLSLTLDLLNLHGGDA